MANDPNRDFLPVKETLDKNVCDQVDPIVVSKFKRPDLEDRFIRLYEENNDLKRLTNCQEGKIKKLGTKLLRVLNEKKSTKSFTSRNGENTNDDFQMKILELEHENYVLKDKNIVLKQQLANHSRQHMAAHRSPVLLHRPPSSPRLSRRQASVPNMNEESFTLSNRHNSSELQLRDAEAHIAGLNEELKVLHAQIESLQMELEKSAVSSQKAQLGENIELIKLRRQNKQLEAQFRAIEHSHKLLLQDVARLQKENEDALQIITEKQNEMIDVQTKLDDAAHIQLEFQEMKGTVSDLMNERDLLKERCEALMKTISEKPNDSDSHRELKMQLADVRKESAVLRQELELIRIENMQAQTSRAPLRKADSFTQTQSEQETNERREGASRLDLNKSSEIVSEPSSARSLIISENSPYNIMLQLAKSRMMALNQTQPSEEPESHPVDDATPSIPTLQPSIDNPQKMTVLGNTAWSGTTTSIDIQQGLNAAAERLSLQREAECLREMLRAQIQRCDVQESQILRLRQEIKLNEQRYHDVFQQRDLFFRLLDKSSHKDEKSPPVDGAANPKSTIVSGEDSEDCPSGSTYIKQPGTYTKSSPAKISSPVSSEIIFNGQILQSGGKQSRPGSANTGSLGRQSMAPISTPPPVPVPRTRRTSAKSATIVEPKKSSDIKVSILWLHLEKDSRLLLDSSVKALYVDFTILSKASECFETPQALPKPENSEMNSVYNFTAVVQWTEEMLDALKSVKERKTQDDVIIFNIVSEPIDDESQDEVQCPVVGVSTVSFQQFAFAEPDEDILLPIYELGKEKMICGTLAVRLAVPNFIFGEL